MPRPRIAILIPCYNEELTIATVVRDFRAELPEAEIYVFDNNSTDRTVERALEAGAQVSHERRQGKGYVVQSMFAQVDADIYVMVDGDGTYPASEVHRLIEPIALDKAEMVVGSRLLPTSGSDFRPLNKLGNRFFLEVINFIFKVKLSDVLSGYRAFSREFVKTIPVFGGGFETEVELTVKALARGYRITELPVRLAARPEGSFSKIRVVQDGFVILNTILALVRDYKPLTFFGSVGLLFILLGFIPGTVVIVEFIKTGLVPKLPSAVLAVGLVLSGMLLLVVGLVLHTITRRFQELEHQLRVSGKESGVKEEVRSKSASS
ncbi:MAG TPA: glycosyltransferase [Candidatus Acidoferrales bacterium]|nr:glycosyltransferase [Candidatus Acidoferrales bacterium]